MYSIYAKYNLFILVFKMSICMYLFLVIIKSGLFINNLVKSMLLFTFFITYFTFSHLTLPLLAVITFLLTY